MGKGKGKGKEEEGKEGRRGRKKGREKGEEERGKDGQERVHCVYYRSRTSAALGGFQTDFKIYFRMFNISRIPMRNLFFLCNLLHPSF